MTTDSVSPTFVNGEVSYWHRSVPHARRRPALSGDKDVDIAIVGGGYTGLWSAYYLKKAQPDLRIAVLEAQFAGYGASGRNGGWLSAEPPGQLRRYAAARGWPAAIALQKAMFDTVHEVRNVAAAESIDAEIHASGVLHIATNAAQASRLHHELLALRRAGWGPDDLFEVGATELRDKIRIPRATAAHWTPHGARIQPARLAAGLADVVERLGVDLYEDTEVSQIVPGAAVTSNGTVHADYVVRATEGFTPGLKGHRRALLPMNSSMIVTEPLRPETWDEIGWDAGELIGDGAHSFCYMQRTPDGRIVVGGRGVPYKFGSRVDADGKTHPVTQRQLRDMLHRYFPAAGNAAIEHAWSGVLGVPRDWCASVRLNNSTGIAAAGGYVGHGVAGTNLAGRTLRDLILRRDTDLTRLPWVDRQARDWEFEPTRWIGVRSLYLAYRFADRREFASDKGTSAVARVADMISGR